MSCGLALNLVCYTAIVRRLIVNADDFGLTAGVNRAIVEAGRNGVVTSTTLMANSHAFGEAASLAKSENTMGVGCHVVLIDGLPVCDGLQSLVNGAGRFRTGLKEFAWAAIQKRIAGEEIQREAEAQIRKIQAAGVTLTHVDTHKHTHIFPHVLGPVLKAARACGIRAIRNPFEPLGSCPPGMLLGTPALWKRTLEMALLRRFAADFQCLVEQENMLTTLGTLGVSTTGFLDQKLLHGMLETVPEGTWELVCHPGYLDADLKAAGTRLLSSRETELEILTSPETKRILDERQIRLISYADL